MLCRPTQRSPSARFSRRVESPIPQYGSFFSIWAFPALHSAILSWLALRSLLSMQLVSTLMQWWDGWHFFLFNDGITAGTGRVGKRRSTTRYVAEPRCRGLRMQQLDCQQAWVLARRKTLALLCRRLNAHRLRDLVAGLRPHLHRTPL